MGFEIGFFDVRMGYMRRCYFMYDWGDFLNLKLSRGDLRRKQQALEPFSLCREIHEN